MQIIDLARSFVSDMFFGMPYLQITDYWDLFIVNFLVVLFVILTACAIYKIFSLIFHFIGGI